MLLRNWHLVASSHRLWSWQNDDPNISDKVRGGASRSGFNLYWNPLTPDVKFSDGSGNVKKVTSTLPSSATLDGIAIFRMGIDTTNITQESTKLAGMVLNGEHQDQVLWASYTN